MEDLKPIHFDIRDFFGLNRLRDMNYTLYCERKSWTEREREYKARFQAQGEAVMAMQQDMMNERAFIGVLKKYIKQSDAAKQNMLKKQQELEAELILRDNEIRSLQAQLDALKNVQFERDEFERLYQGVLNQLKAEKPDTEIDSIIYTEQEGHDDV